MGGTSRGPLAIGLAMVAVLVAAIVAPRALPGWSPAVVGARGSAAAGPIPAAAVALGRQAEAGSEASGTLRETLIQAVLEELPPPPAFLRLVRITLQPGASVPLHSHPGPEFGWMETGSLTIRVEGQAVVAPAAAGGTPQPARVLPSGEEFELRPGDQIVYPAEVPFTLANLGQGPASVLTAVVLPAGSGSPPGSAWVDGTPGPDAMQGVSSEILGDAVVPGWPQPPLAIVVDRLVLGSGATIPPRAGPVLLSVEQGRFGFELIDGQFQVSGGESGPRPNATPGAAYSLGRGDAVFFPGGMTEVPRPGSDGLLVVLRLSVLGAAPPDSAAPTEPATPVPGEPPPRPPAAEGVATPVPPAADGFAVGADVVVTTSGVRLRDAPSAGAGVVAEVDEGRVLEVVGPPVEGDGIAWYPVRAVDDPAIAGFIAADFVAPAP